MAEGWFVSNYFQFTSAKPETHKYRLNFAEICHFSLISWLKPTDVSWLGFVLMNDTFLHAPPVLIASILEDTPGPAVEGHEEESQLK